MDKLARSAAAHWLKALALLAPLALASCGDDKPASTTTAPAKPAAPIMQPAPTFNADSAYQFVAQQVAFGPRVPNTPQHRRTALWLQQQFARMGTTVQVQNYTSTSFDGVKLNGSNIIATINPQAKRRILLAAHWDTRPFGDQDTERTREPIDGANDGGSGVGVLLEVARVLGSDSTFTQLGVDFILFDLEDYGPHDEWEDRNQSRDGGASFWCLGSRYWSENKHQPGYSAYYGILLDMVGGPNARFAQEGSSMRFAPSVVKKVWQTAAAIGYGDRFPTYATDPLIDDHVNVNTIAKINMIDIIEHDPSNGTYFNRHWHTHADNMDNVSPETLKAVGQTLIQVLYNEAAAVAQP